MPADPSNSPVPHAAPHDAPHAELPPALAVGVRVAGALAERGVPRLQIEGRLILARETDLPGLIRDALAHYPGRSLVINDHTGAPLVSIAPASASHVLTWH
jgi:hypothetical protein